MRRENFFVGERGSKVSQFAKNAPLEALIVLARDERFLLSVNFSKIYQRGDHWLIFSKILILVYSGSTLIIVYPISSLF